MEAYVSNRTADKSRWKAMVITIFLLRLTSQVQTQRVVIERWSPHTPAVIGQRVTLACIFSSPVNCTWSTGDHNGVSKEVRSGDGYSYEGDYKTTDKATKDCSLTIADVKEQDMTMWFCTGLLSNKQVHSPWTYITKQATPSAPITWFNSDIVSEIELPSPHPLSRMVCGSQGGNPPPSLHWEVDGTVYSGILETIPAEAINCYTVYLLWDKDSNWKILDHASEVICKANHPGFTDTKMTKVELRRKYEMKVNFVNDSGGVSTPVDGGSNGPTTIIIAVSGITLIMAIVISTAIVIRIRRKQSSSIQVSPSSHACPNAREGNRHTNRTLGSTAASSSTNIVLYEDAWSCTGHSVRQTDVDASGYLIPLPIYEEIKCEDG